MTIKINRGRPKWLPSLRYNREVSVETWIRRRPIVLISCMLVLEWYFHITVEWYR